MKPEYEGQRCCTLGCRNKPTIIAGKFKSTGDDILLCSNCYEHYKEKARNKHVVNIPSTFEITSPV